MKLRAKLAWFPLIAVYAILVLGGMGAYTTRELHRAMREKKTADRIVEQVVSLDVLTYEYMLYELPRARQQWWRTFAGIDDLVSEVRFAGPEAETMLSRIREQHAMIGDTFADVLKNRERLKEEAVDHSMLQETENRLVGQLLQESQSMLSGATRLSDSISSMTIASHSRLNAFGGALLLLMFATVLVASVLIGRSITRPLDELHVGVDAIGGGNLDYRIALASRDEFGALARAFDRMAGDLKRITASRDDLDHQVAVRRRAETELRRVMHELKRSNGELEQFAYVASHDLQEPLRKIGAFGDLLEEECRDVLTDEGRDYMGRMQNAVTRMQSLINALLSLSRVATRAKPFVPVDLKQTVEGVLSDLQLSVEESGAHVEVDDLPVVEADATQMRQLMQNLVGNALKFRREGEPLVVRIRTAKDDPDSAGMPDYMCRIVVEDNGIGFDEKHSERIFGVFQRLHGRTAYPGSGIGLSICRKIVDRHSGDITAESTPGEGSKFTVSLPIQQARQDKEA
ncbi:MAG: HAMP domain-containing protein [Lentisphaerae bacterium]|nr:HAMP domain-containing protein [Lentisphaerota bacterium]